MNLHPNYSIHLTLADVCLNRCTFEINRPLRNQGATNEAEIKRDVLSAINELRFVIGDIDEAEYIRTNRELARKIEIAHVINCPRCSKSSERTHEGNNYEYFYCHECKEPFKIMTTGKTNKNKKGTCNLCGQSEKECGCLFD